LKRNTKQVYLSIIMRIRSSSLTALAVSLLAKDVVALVHGGHQRLHDKRAQLDVTVYDDVYETKTVTQWVTAEWNGEAWVVPTPTPNVPAAKVQEVTTTSSSTHKKHRTRRPTKSSTSTSKAPAATSTAPPAPAAPAPVPTTLATVVAPPAPVVPTTIPVPIVPSVAPVKVSETPATTTVPSATSATSAPSTPNGGKRGLAYNSAALTNAFAGSGKVSWAYNWGSTSDGLSGKFEYVPMLWGTGADKTGNWNDAANKALVSGSTYLLGFNEPDHSQQANISPSAAAAGWMQFMQPFAGKAKLGSPAVTNGGGDMGLTYLGNFLGACGGCTIDFVNIHWYDSASNVAYFKKHVQDAYAAGKNRPLWITEFGASGSIDEQNTFLSEVIPWLDSQDFVERYAYFMVSDGVLVTGTSLSKLGNTFAFAG
jgi:hypothetical protein